MRHKHFSTFESFQPKKMPEREIVRDKIQLDAYLEHCQRAEEFQLMLYNLPKQNKSDFMVYFMVEFMRHLQVNVSIFHKNDLLDFYLTKQDVDDDGNILPNELHLVVQIYRHNGTHIYYNRKTFLQPLIDGYAISTHDAEIFIIKILNKYYQHSVKSISEYPKKMCYELMRNTTFITPEAAIKKYS